MDTTTNDFKGLWIPFQILTDDNLSDKEKFILCLILYKSKFLGNCSLSNRYLSNLFNISETQVSKLISSLVKKNYIDIQLMYENNSKEIKSRLIIPKKFVFSYMNLSIKQKLNTSLINLNEPIQHNFKDNIKYYKNNKYNNNSCNFESRKYDADYLNSFYANI